jgi:hypothetical protein
MAQAGWPRAETLASVLRYRSEKATLPYRKALARLRATWVWSAAAAS